MRRPKPRDEDGFPMDSPWWENGTYDDITKHIYPRNETHKNLDPNLALHWLARAVRREARQDYEGRRIAYSLSVETALAHAEEVLGLTEKKG